MTSWLKSWIGSIRTVALGGLVVWLGGPAGADPHSISITAPSSAPCQFYIATNGNDANPGTQSQPFATLEHARDFVCLHKLGATGPIQVCLRGGTYELQRTFTLGPGDSGTAAAPITYRSYPGEQAILSGGVQIHPNWSPYSGQIQVAVVGQWFNELFINGQRATRARSPNGIGSFRLAPVANPALQASSFLYQAGSVPAGLSNSDVEVVSMERFQSPRQRVASTNAITLTVEGSTDSRNPYGSDYAATDRYYIENSLAALDSPGEWYLDKSTNKLYYWPLNEGEISNGVFVVPRLHQLVHAGSYPENADFDNILAPYIPSCRHIGVYPQAPGSLAFAQQSFTVATWLRFPSGTQDPFWVFSSGDPMGTGATGAGGQGYGLSTQSTSSTVPIQFFVNDGTHRISANIPAQPRATWVHVAFVIDRAAKQMRAYINGALADTESLSLIGSIASTVPLDIGAYTNAGCSSGALSDFRIYSSSLSPAQVAELATGASTLIGALALWLPFNGDFIDHSATGTDTVVFFPPVFTAGVAGNRAADFSTAFPTDISGSTDYVGFSDLTFEYADWVMPFTGFPGSSVAWTSPGAVYLHSRHASVNGNSFLHLGSNALTGMLANSTVTNNTFFDLGGGAIRIGQNAATEPQQATLAQFASNDTITGNQVSGTGIVDRDSFVVWVGPGSNTTISQNTVANAPYIGISISGGPGGVSALSDGNNRISYNRISYVMELLNDGGAIYVNCTQPGTMIDHNIIHDVVMTPAHIANDFIWGIYLDGGANSFLVRDNLTYRTEWGGIMLNSMIYGNGNNVVTNNIFADGIAYQLTLNNAGKDAFQQNIVYDGKSSSTQFFYLTAPAAIGSSDYNLFYGASFSGFADQFAAWRALGFDAHSIVADPLFAGYTQDDFTLLPSSPAVLPMGRGGIGFLPIDFTKP